MNRKPVPAVWIALASAAPSRPSSMPKARESAPPAAPDERGGRPSEIRAITEKSLEPGDEIVIETEESSLRASLAPPAAPRAPRNPWGTLSGLASARRSRP